MSLNVEFKAYCEAPDRAARACSDLGMELARDVKQSDTYLAAPRGRLKVRQDGPGEGALILYERTDSPDVRVSEYDLVPLGDRAEQVAQVLARGLGVRIKVVKRRRTYESGPALVNIDEVADIGSFVEVEVDVPGAGGEDAAGREASGLAERLGIQRIGIVPWSYSDLALMRQASREWRERLESVGSPGSLFLLDGASCVGKTTLAQKLRTHPDLSLAFAPRYCTRQPREGEHRGSSDYVFVTRQEFGSIAASGGFLEYRDFKFGMSYGLRWEEAVGPLLRQQDVVGIMDLGTIRHVNWVMPEAVTVLITASEDTIRARLERRGVHEETHIEERLDNARLAREYAPFYDHVLDHDELSVDESTARLLDIIADRAGTSRARPVRAGSWR